MDKLKYYLIDTALKNRHLVKPYSKQEDHTLKL